MSNERTFVITIRPMASSIPAILRVRKLLKFALRSLDLRCVDIREASPSSNGATAAEAR